MLKNRILPLAVAAFIAAALSTPLNAVTLPYTILTYHWGSGYSVGDVETDFGGAEWTFSTYWKPDSGDISWSLFEPLDKRIEHLGFAIYTTEGVRHELTKSAAPWLWEFDSPVPTFPKYAKLTSFNEWWVLIFGSSEDGQFGWREGAYEMYGAGVDIRRVPDGVSSTLFSFTSCCFILILVRRFRFER